MSRGLLAAASVAFATLVSPGYAADTTWEQLVNAPKNARNWLTVHRDYDNSRHSPLSEINRGNVKDLKLKFIASIGGRATGGTMRGKEEGTPLVEDGFMYVSDTWSRVTKFDVRSGTQAVPIWRYDPKIKRSRVVRGLAMYGNKVFVLTYDARVIALDKESGKVAWEVDGAAPQDPVHKTPSKVQGFSGAPLAIKTKGGKELLLVGESTGGSMGTRSWLAGFDVNTGALVWRTFTIPGPGEPGHETWKDNHNAWRIGGASIWQTGSFDPATNLYYVGTGDAFPTFDPEFRPGDNLYTASTLAFDVDTGKIVWYFQETPNEHWDFDTPSPKMLYETTINGETRKVVANFSRNGFFYTLDRNSGQFIRADQFQEKVTWTKGIDPKTGKPLDYDPSKDVQLYAGLGTLRSKRGQESCPAYSGAPTFFPPTFDAKRQIAYVAAAEGCMLPYLINKPMDEARDWVGTRMCCQEGGRTVAHGALWAVDVRTGKVVNKATYPLPNESGMLSTGGDLLFTGHHTGAFTAYDPDTLKELWTFNLGTPITAPAMSYSVNGKQYIAIIAGGDANLRGAQLYQPSAFVAVFGL